MNIAATTDPASVGPHQAQGRTERPRTGQVVFVGVTSAGSVGALTGTITYDGQELDLSSVVHTDTNADGVIDTGEQVARLNAAAAAQGFTHRPDPFVDDGDDLIFRGAEPAADATAAELTARSPQYSELSDDVLAVAASTSVPPQGGMLTFPGTSAADLPFLRGSITVNGNTLELGAVDYGDSAVISGSEALSRLNAAAQAAGITTDDHAFVESRLLTLSEDEYADHGRTLRFLGPTPPEGATSAELTSLSPVFTPGQDTITMIDAAIRTVSTQRAGLGALQNRLEHTIANLDVAHENTVASLSRIRDADMAQELVSLTRDQVLRDAGAAMAAQANQSTRNVLRLLQA
ncbi:flagellin [Blastococcus brunescens]|uniref:Flagellin n=1 Tax=Blastococcus brunescens TaxID=1564165 RepID=A0ABZ1B3F2_9ACTN|nr:flagellin [Blastococcus sp. BMG 8361]WRL65334.1 flagellin [Blastococcus sp. BMG 8361]